MMKKLFLFVILISILFFYSAFAVVAQEKVFSVSPSVLDYKAFAGDNIRGKLALNNLTGRKFDIFAQVNNILSNGGKQNFLDPTKADFTSSLANWILIKRAAIEFQPNEAIELDYTIEVSSRAVPGTYHAIIAFSKSRSEDDLYPDEGSYVMVNLEVREDIREKLQLMNFIPVKNIFFSMPAKFEFVIENNGNKALSPDGEIRIYNRKGKEVDFVKVSGIEAIQPSQKTTNSVFWENAKNMGRYKALLYLNYGASQKGTLQDTVFFWYIPFLTLVLFIIFLFLFSALVSLYIHKRYMRHHQHLADMARSNNLIIKKEGNLATKTNNSPEKNQTISDKAIYHENVEKNNNKADSDDMIVDLRRKK